MIRRPLLAACLSSVLLLTACGEKQDDIGAAPRTQKLSLMLDYFPNADHAPIYAAVGNGAFKTAGLDVDIQTPGDPSTPLKLVAAGKVDVAISYEPDLLLARDKGAKLIAIGALVQKPLTSIISLPAAKIAKPADLAGKTVSTAGIPYQSAYLKTILEQAGVNPSRVKEVNVKFNLVPSILSKKGADATLGAFWNYEGVELERAKKNPQILKVDDLGVPTYNELVLVTREQDVRDRGPLLRRFVQALQSGALAVKADPTAGVDPLIAASKDLDRGLQLASVKATLPVFFPAKASNPYGWQEPREWQAFGEWMKRNKLLENEPNAAAFTNEFLPGEGGKPAESSPNEVQPG
ncbi:Formylaminopyrimidine-binding protein [Paraconexibacter sp. AEG42_29]|uniref:Formylaminopyrimidine-binding protein n=1 Tax=Paraconexibacter sp. AEG42_29 TaxID=2997339 RepID=A0AAU7ASP7_9ACTN